MSISLGLSPCGSACVSDLDRSGFVGVEPAIEVTAHEPASEASVDTLWPAVVVRFGDPLDPRQSAFDDALVLAGSGGLGGAGRAVYDPVEWTLSWRPSGPLAAGRDYELRVNETALVGADGRPIAPFAPVAFRTAVDANDDPPDSAPVIRWPEVAPLLEGCSCHASTPRAFPALSYVALTTERSASLPSRRFVVPFAPAESYLLEKVLPDYPNRHGTVMPPPWGDVPPLAAESIRVLAQWIEGGALP